MHSAFCIFSHVFTLFYTFHPIFFLQFPPFLRIFLCSIWWNGVKKGDSLFYRYNISWQFCWFCCTFFFDLRVVWYISRYMEKIYILFMLGDVTNTLLLCIYFHVLHKRIFCITFSVSRQVVKLYSKLLLNSVHVIYILCTKLVLLSIIEILSVLVSVPSEK